MLGSWRVQFLVIEPTPENMNIVIQTFKKDKSCYGNKNRVNQVNIPLTVIGSVLRQ